MEPAKPLTEAPGDEDFVGARAQILGLSQGVAPAAVSADSPPALGNTKTTSFTRRATAPSSART